MGAIPFFNWTQYRSRLKPVQWHMFNLPSLCVAPSWNEDSGCHPGSDKAKTSPFLWEQGQLSFEL